MKQILLLKLLLSHALLLCYPCSSLPFGRGKKAEEDNLQTNTIQPAEEDPISTHEIQRNESFTSQEIQDEHASVRGAASSISQETHADTNHILEFFSSSALELYAPQALQEEIHEMSNSEHMKNFLTTTRRSLHRHPELMYQETFTSDTIQTILKELDIKFTTGWAKNTHEEAFAGPGGYGVVGVIGTGEEPCIILRADMDALPINEQTQQVDSFQSRTAGKMHACGHDGHVTMLLGAAALLKQVEASIVGTIRLVFQPAEEGGAGGKRMVEEGVVTTSPPARHAFGMHVWPTLPSGVIASRPGAIMAAAEMFEIKIEGKGGHAAMPHLAIDPIVTASALVMNLQTIVSRIVSPLEAGVVSVTMMSAGDAFNVIPSVATIRGTIRALSTEMLLSLRDRVSHMVSTTSEMHRCNYTLTYSPDYYPPTVNDPELFNSFSKNVGKLLSKDWIDDIEPTMGGEDFSFFGEAIPSTFFFLGQGSGGDEAHHLPPTNYGLHNPSFALDETVMPVGVELHVNLALRSLRKLKLEDEEGVGQSAEL